MTGEVDRGYSTGLIVQSVTSSISRYLDIPFIKGVIIIEITKDSPALLSGLEPGDVILTVNGQEVNKPSDIRTVILENDLRSGDKVNLYILEMENTKRLK